MLEKIPINKAISLQEAKRPLRFKGLSLRILAYILETHDVNPRDFVQGNLNDKKELGLRPSELIKLTKAKPHSVFIALERLSKAKLVKKENDKWKATILGELYLNEFRERAIGKLKQKIENLEEETFLRSFINELIKEGRDFKLVAIAKREGKITRPLSYSLAQILGLEANSQNCLLAQTLVNELARKELLEVDEHEEGIIIRPSQELLGIVFNERKERVNGLKEINEINDIVKRVRKHKGKIYSYTYLRTFKIKNKREFKNKKLKSYMKELKQRYPFRIFDYFDNFIYKKKLWTYSDFENRIKFYFEINKNGFKVYMPQEEKITRFTNFKLRTILTKLKLLEKPKYKRLA